MKTKSHVLLAPFLLAFVLAINIALPAPVLAGPGGAPPEINPSTGLPLPAVDPATGLPADGSAPFSDVKGGATWIDPNWSDPDKVLSSVDYNGIPLSAMAQMLREQFNAAFDIIVPSGANGQWQPYDSQVTLHLKNVKASEVFMAMNMEFELDKAPWRWELTVNGSRQTVLLRYLSQLVPAAPPAPAQKRVVVYVGNLLPSMNTEQISNAIKYAWQVSGIDSGGTVQSYPAGDLLIVSGTPDQVDLAQQTLAALKEKAFLEGREAPLAKPQPAK